MLFHPGDLVEVTNGPCRGFRFTVSLIKPSPERYFFSQILRTWILAEDLVLIRPGEGNGRGIEREWADARGA